MLRSTLNLGGCISISQTGFDRSPFDAEPGAPDPLKIQQRGETTYSPIVKILEG